MSEVKILVSCHKKFPVPAEPVLLPIQVGAALGEEHFDGFLRDDSGDNISAKNRSYCELTAQYWAWKNLKADSYGFFHYRRYLYPDLRTDRPYRMEAQVSEALLGRLGFASMESLAGQYDIIVPIAEDMRISVREHYGSAPHHFAADLELAESTLSSRHPEMRQAAEAYFSGSRQYFGNIFIMKRELFFEYCRWLFPLLEEFERQCDMSGRTAQELRAPGYIAERLFGVFYTWKRDSALCLELPRVHFEPDRTELLKKRALNFLLPPGSMRRAIVKKLRQ